MEPLELFIAAVGLAIFLEGLPYFISPAGVRATLEQVGRLGDGVLRLLGLLMMIVGLAVAYWATR